MKIPTDIHKPYHMKYCTLAVLEVEIGEKHYRDHHIYHHCDVSYHRYALMLLLSLLQSGMPYRVVEQHQ